MNTAPEKTSETWRQMRVSLPGATQIRSFLGCGAMMAWSEDRWIIAWGKPGRAARPDADRPSFYAPDFFLRDKKPWRIYGEAAVVTPDSLAQLLAPRESARCWKPFDETAFASAFAKVMEEFRAGSLQKAVPAVFETSRGALTAAERERALRNAANLPAGLMPYGFWDRDGGAIGASPELLFEDDGVEIHTVAVAGTARSGARPEDMMDDPKERNEHRLVLDDVAARLATLGRVTAGATRLWRIGILSHLRTDLRVAPRGKAEFAALISRLHPTPAVGIAPRGDWRKSISGIDGAPRGCFGAPFGLALPGGRSRCLVAIRGVQWDREATRCGAGCGIVPGSELPRELAELRLKLSATRDNLGL
ncbi:MAG: chorismate-binding protein [Chthoniobacterales bacterium]|nr:chorismate-binding protein [Chthoniobacterales bacterium]